MSAWSEVAVAQQWVQHHLIVRLECLVRCTFDSNMPEFRTDTGPAEIAARKEPAVSSVVAVNLA